MAVMPIVVGVDGSEESLRAVEWAGQEAKRHRAPLRLVSAPVLPPRMRPHGSNPPTVADELSGESARALSAAVTRTEEVSPGLLVDTSQLAGVPALAVTDSGAGALMLVVGARGGGGFAQLLLGSVSRYAAMHATCPVVVVRERTSAVHGAIVVGVGDPRDSTATLDFAFNEAAARGATVVAVHCWNWNPAANWQPDGPERVAADADGNLADVLRPWEEKFPHVPVRRDVAHDHPGRVLGAYAGRADLVIVGRHRRGGAPAVGGIQHAVLNHARGPVAIVPDPD